GQIDKNSAIIDLYDESLGHRRKIPLTDDGCVLLKISLEKQVSFDAFLSVNPFSRLRSVDSRVPVQLRTWFSQA
ncbi:MAG TPA: hypothetical protein VGR14_22180, partial [Verrucomicrobiae bacterium]|nr:hypothetical protein [Verrucomicrobiae bacterium]